MTFPRLASFLTLCASLVFSGCAIKRLPEDLGYGVLNNPDLATVRDGLPTYLLIIDGALITYPKNKKLLLTSASLNSAYGGVFVDDDTRKLLLTEKALAHATKAICLYKKRACNIRNMPFSDFEQVLDRFSKPKDLPYLFGLASVWTSYIELTSDDYNSIANLARVEALMKRVTDIDVNYENGMPLVYLGALNSLIPKALGGKPEQAKAHFEKAIAVSSGKNLIAKVLYAEKYARLVFDQELHDALLKEVLAADSAAHGLTLQNEYAKREAKRLLAESSDYF